MERDLIGMLQGEGLASDGTRIDRRVGLRYREDEIHVDRGLELRYREQLWEIMVPMESASIDLDTIEGVVDAFHERHHEIYTYSEPDNVCELVSLAVRATVPRRLPELDWDLGTHDSWVRLGERSVRHRDRFLITPVFDGRQSPRIRTDRRTFTDPRGTMHRLRGTRLDMHPRTTRRVFVDS